MTTRLDDKLVPRVLAILAKYGKEVDFIVEGLKSYDAATRDATTAGPKKYPHKVTPPEPYKQSGGDVQMGDSKVLLPASGLEFEPSIGQVVVIDKQQWTIRSTNPVYSGELVAVWELQLRRSRGTATT